ncbi:MAG TPA: glutathione synthase [Chromatiales bacterium]|nr:glutathione synthase [Chromatiaceae bacterium]HIB83138.1 glutathione synthase [Chromatiaceae bacterium]HIN82270.1 glutathione synthase [Chromatiales bacterium]HIO53819.1 glutathione synthase [Chromatiales bacterium]
MGVSLGVVMDPIADIHPAKDTTLAMLLSAQQRGWKLYYIRQNDLHVRDGVAWARMQALNVHDDLSDWFTLGESISTPLADIDIVLMRKDPPFDIDYIYSTYILELAQQQGTLVANDPEALRDCNEKVYTAWFPQCCPESLVAANNELLIEFIHEHQDVIVKPLDGMGGASIFRVQTNDANLAVILETLTQHGHKQIMAQRYIPEIIHGDKRIILIDGEPIPYALARIPAEGETRANLAAGGQGKGIELSARDRWICAEIGPALKEQGLLFVGIDVIGDYLTEINVTSPTGVREIEKQFDIDICDQFISCLESHL